RAFEPMKPSVKPIRSPTTSIVAIRGNTPRIWEIQDVPHGAVRLHDYQSKSLGRLRHLRVYTPPDYDHGNSRYPVLYLLHGSGDNEATWTAFGHAHWILDKLTAARKRNPVLGVLTGG